MFAFDWQFGVVTTVALGACWVLLRRLTSAFSRKSATSADPACPHCAMNERPRAASPERAPRTTTTPVVSLDDLRQTVRKPQAGL